MENQPGYGRRSGDNRVSRLIRQICACIAVTLLVTMQAYGVASARHQIEHGLQFADISFGRSVQLDHHGHGDDDAQILVVGVDHASVVLIEPDSAGDDQPVRHHHHNGVDLHVAMAGGEWPTETRLISSVNLGPTPGALPPGADPDLPSDPPRQLRA